MKAFFILLLLTNIIFGLVQWLFPFNQVKHQSQPQLATERLNLLDEDESQFQQNAASGVTVGESLKSDKNNDIPATPDKLCYTLGPFKEQQVSQEVALKFKQNKIPISSRSSQEKEYRGMMVYVDGHDSRKAAIETAESLASKGIRDYIIVNEPERANILSLGVFSLKKNADRRLKKIEKLGYPVKSEARYRNRTIYWLDYSESETENLTRFIDMLKVEKGISRISRECGK